MIEPGARALDDALQSARALHEAGRLQEAEAIYTGILNACPQHAEALHLLGVIACQVGKHPVAVRLLERSIGLQPDNSPALGNLGIALRALGRDEEAIVLFEKALLLQPDFAPTHNNLGNALHALGRVDAAVRSYRRAIAITPDYAEAHNNLGVALHDQGRVEEAIDSYERAIALQPDHAQARNHLAFALHDAGRLDEALAQAERAVALNEADPHAHANRGAILQAKGQLSSALASYRRALALAPADAGIHNNLGSALQALGHLSDAATSYRRALALRPDFAMAHCNLGNVDQLQGRLEAAVASYRRAIDLQPANAEAHSNLGVALKEQGRIAEAMACYQRAIDVQPDYLPAHTNRLFAHHYLSDRPPGEGLAAARRFGEIVARQAHPWTSWDNRPDPHRPLRIGWVSGDFREHPVGYFLQSVFEALHRQAAGRLASIAYSTNGVSDDLSARLRVCCLDWREVPGVPDQALAGQIRADGIDILVDLSGHTAHNRLAMFAWKPAPVQVSWLGYFATTGVAAIDYLLADPHTLPESEEGYFTEEIWRLPQTRLCFTAPNEDIDVSALPAVEHGYLTFACFNHLSKMNEAVVALWSRVLEAVPRSRLLLKAAQLVDETVRQSVLARFAVHGIDAGRLILEAPQSRRDYLAAYRRVDIALDPFPFPGGTVTAESLWMGVPVLTLAGSRFISRQGVGLLHNAALPAWIAGNADEYVACCVAWASDLEALARLRAGLRRQVLDSALFDAARFACHLEAALRGMWMRWCGACLAHGTTAPPDGAGDR